MTKKAVCFDAVGPLSCRVIDGGLIPYSFNFDAAINSGATIECTYYVGSSMIVILNCPDLVKPPSKPHVTATVKPKHKGNK